MKATLYSNSANYKRVNKSAYLNTISKCDAEPYENCALLRPTIVIDTALAGDLSRVNYMYIDTFDRYYFCTPTLLTGGLTLLSGDVDALMSFSSQIRNMRCYVYRNEKLWNKMLPDLSIPVEKGKVMRIKKFTATPFSANPQGVNYVLTVSGAGKTEVQA